MNRVYFVWAAGLTLAGCASMPGMDFLKVGPQTATMQFESEPAGAEARTSLGSTCRTPCAVPVTTSEDFTVTFTLAGYRPVTVPVEMVAPLDPRVDPNPRFAPNPVSVELEAAAPSGRRKAPARKPRLSAAKHARAPAAAPASAAPEAPATPFPPTR